MARYRITLRCPDVAPDATPAPGFSPASPTTEENPVALVVTGAAAGATLRVREGELLMATATAGETGVDSVDVDLAVGTHQLSVTAQLPGHTESLPLVRTLVVDRFPSCTLALPAASSGLLVPVTLASPDLDLVGYLLSESGAAPAADDERWVTAPPAEFLFADPGDVAPPVARPLYAWVKDAAGHVSARAAASVALSLPPTATPVVHQLPADLREGEDLIIVVDVPQAGKAAPASAPPYPDEIAITTEGDSFAPLLTVDEGAVVEWIWADGTHSRERAPTKAFGSAASRTHRLRVVPWSALRAINLGYDHGDGGSLAIPDRNQQRVSAITGLANPTGLTTLCLSHNPITTLDLSGCATLETVECFLCEQLASIDLAGAVSIKRLCLEDANLSALNLTDQVLLEDFRGAVNNFGPGSIVWGAPHVHEWHMCLRSQAVPGVNIPDLSDYAALRELWIWDTGLTEALTLPRSGALTSFYAYGNGFPQAAVDSMLAQLVAIGASGGTVELQGSAAPSAAGYAHVQTLWARGWIVHVES